MLVVLVVFGLGSVVLVELGLLGLLELVMDSEVEGSAAFGTVVLPGMESALLGQPAVLWSVGYLRLGFVVCWRPDTDTHQCQPRVPFWGLVVTQQACYPCNCASVFYHTCICWQVASSHGKCSSPLCLCILEQKGVLVLLVEYF